MTGRPMRVLHRVVDAHLQRVGLDRPRDGGEMQPTLVERHVHLEQRGATGCHPRPGGRVHRRPPVHVEEGVAVRRYDVDVQPRAMRLNQVVPRDGDPPLYLPRRRQMVHAGDPSAHRQLKVLERE